MHGMHKVHKYKEVLIIDTNLNQPLVISKCIIQKYANENFFMCHKVWFSLDFMKHLAEEIP